MQFQRQYTERGLANLFDSDFRLPDGFMFGVANAAYQVEGGYNGPGEPLNNWLAFERSGKVEPCGEAIRFWTGYADQIETAQKMNLNAFRLSIEWARVQPCTSVRTGSVPKFDPEAIERYAEIIAAVMRAGMEPVVTLHHFTHPFWVGIDFWLERQKLDLFRRYVEEAVTRINTLLVEKHGLRPIEYYVTLNEPNGLAMLLYLVRYFPHRKAGLSSTAAAWSNMIDAHCRAYDTIHRVYEEKGWKKPLVTYNTIHFSVYHADKVMTDMLLARRNDVGRSALAGFLDQGRKAWDAEIAKCPKVRKDPVIGTRVESLASRIAARFFTADRFNDGVDAIYASDYPEKLDFLAIDYYDPFLRNMLKGPDLEDVREKRFHFNQELWEQVLNPAGLYHFMKAETINGEGLPLIVLESGMCHRVFKGRAEPRHDGATRDRFLQSYIYEVMRALKDGVPVKGYFHWTLTDNYEWGSYEPRFGLMTADRSRTPARISSVDAWGVNAADAYSEIVASLTSGDTARMLEAFRREEW